jgi:uncharacterized protein YjbI with pentapeptide repeats
MDPRYSLALLTGLIGMASLVTVAPAQTAPPKEPLALFDVAFYGKGANSLERGDPLVAAMTDSILRADLEQSGRFQVIDSARLAQAIAQTEAAGVECVTLECRQQVSKKVGADWMVTAKLSKTSNLIWYLSGQLTDLASGKRLLDDEFELKGIAEDIAKGGAHSMARRIAKAATAAQTVDTPTTRMDLPQLKAKLAAATEDKPPDLSKVDLSGLDLSGVDFKRANLTGAKLAGTKLVGANLFTADLTDAVLTDADLTKANLDGSVLRRANLHGANLQDASLFATIVESADLSNANLGGARIIGYLRGANLSGASLRRTNAGADPGNQSMGVMRATFVSADLSGADLSDANLYKADFSHAKLTNAKLAQANLMNADLVQTDLTRADLTGAKLAQANLDEANFTNAVGVSQIQGLDQARNRDKAIFDAK